MTIENVGGSIDFAALAETRKPVSRNNVVILGGVISGSEMPQWLDAWGLSDLPWRLWEWVSDLRLEEATLPSDIEYLERGRLFGPGGDLTLRRDGDQFRWWFVGAPETTRPKDLDGCDFWTTNKEMQLYRVEQRAILWGVWDDNLGRWYDDRVGFAKLEYPASLQQHKRVYTRYWEYLDAGQVAFVWIHGLGAKGN